MKKTQYSKEVETLDKVLKSIETTRNKLNELDRFGLNTEKRRAKLDQAEELVSKGKFRTAKNLVNEAQLLNIKDAENLRLAKLRVAEEKKLKRERLNATKESK